MIDISLIASLVLMVMLACYEKFVTGFELSGYKYKSSWMGHTDFGELKVKLLTSIVAISAFHVLELFMNVAPASDHELAWSVGILIAFVLSVLLLAVMNRNFSGRTRMSCRLVHCTASFCEAAFIIVVIAAPVIGNPAAAQSANSNAGLESGQDGLFGAILGTPNRTTTVPHDNIVATPLRAGQAAPTSHSKTKRIEIPPVLNSTSPA